MVIDKFKKIKIILEKSRYSLLGSGVHRLGYWSEANENYIIKIPIDTEGEHHNYGEYFIYEKYRESKRYARCWLFFIEEIPILLMEKVLVIDFRIAKKFEDNLPQWCFKIDSFQIGLDINNNIVAYDYYDQNCEELYVGMEQFDLELGKFKEDIINSSPPVEPEIKNIVDKLNKEKEYQERNNYERCILIEG